MDKIKLVEFQRTCIAAPSQWEGKTNDNRLVYVRLRRGKFRIVLGKPGNEDIFEVVRNGQVVMEQNEDWPYDDEIMDDTELQSYTKEIFDWSGIDKIIDGWNSNNV